MVRQMIHIDEEKCNGCGLCARACHEGAIDIVDGKARLVRESFCDGLGDCLPGCPTGAISFETREAPAYDEQAVQSAKRQRSASAPHVCPGMMARQMRTRTEDAAVRTDAPSQLQNWPVQLRLTPITAPCFAGAQLLIAADCAAYAYATFHQDFMRGRATLIGCPKLDSTDYSDKLTDIIRHNDLTGVTVVRMEVPCCGGLEAAVRRALESSGKQLPCQVVTLSMDGNVLSK